MVNKDVHQYSIANFGGILCKGWFTSHALRCERIWCEQTIRPFLHNAALSVARFLYSSWNFYFVLFSVSTATSTNFLTFHPGKWTLFRTKYFSN